MFQVDLVVTEGQEIAKTSTSAALRGVEMK